MPPSPTQNDRFGRSTPVVERGTGFEPATSSLEGSPHDSACVPAFYRFEASAPYAENRTRPRQFSALTTNKLPQYQYESYQIPTSRLAHNSWHASPTGKPVGSRGVRRTRALMTGMATNTTTRSSPRRRRGPGHRRCSRTGSKDGSFRRVIETNLRELHHRFDPSQDSSISESDSYCLRCAQPKQ